MSRTLVTGANRGIGLELCRQLHARGAAVIAVCRRSSPDLDGLGLRVEANVDVTDDDSVRALAERIGDARIDVMVHNAGILESGGFEALDIESLRRQFEVNSIGPLRVTRALLPNLGAGSRIAIVTSLMGSMGDNGSGGNYGYRMSKAAVNSAGVSLARDLASRKISVAILHPGWVQTDMTGNSGPLTTTESARGLIERIDALTLETSGTFRHADGRILPW